MVSLQNHRVLKLTSRYSNMRLGIIKNRNLFSDQCSFISLLWGWYFMMPGYLLFLYFPSPFLNFCSGLASEPVGVIVGISLSSAQQCILFGLQQQWLSLGASPSEDSCCIFCHTDESQGAGAPLLPQSLPLRGCGHWALALITLVT